MMKCKKEVLASLSFIFLAGCVGTPLVERIKYTGTDFESWSGEGIVYALPKTKIEAVFDISKTEFKPPYCKADLCEDGGCAAEYSKEAVLETLNVKKDAVDHFGIIAYGLHSGVVSAKAVIDQEKVFVSRLPESSFFSNSSLLLTLDGNGLVEGVDGMSSSKAVEFAAKVVELGFSIATSAVPYGAPMPISKEERDTDERKNDCRAMIDEYRKLEKEINEYRTRGTPYPVETVNKFQAEYKIAQGNIKEAFVGKSESTVGKA